MQTNKYSKGQVIFKAGDKVEHFSVIADGDVLGVSAGHSFTLGRSDVMGLSDLKGGTYTYTFTALADATVCLYPCAGFGALEAFLRDNADIAFLILMSMCRHTDSLLDYSLRLKRETENVPSVVSNLFEEYCRLCKLYGAAQKELPAVAKTADIQSSDVFPERKRSYYSEISKFPVDMRRKFFHGNTGITSVFLFSTCDDIASLLKICSLYSECLKQSSGQLFNEAGSGLFSMISQLYLDTAGNEAAAFAVETLMTSLTDELSKLVDLSVIDAQLYQKKQQEYWDAVEDIAGGGGGGDDLFAMAGDDDVFEEGFDASDGAIAGAEDALDAVDLAAATGAIAPAVTEGGGVASVGGAGGDVALNPKLKNSLEEILAFAEAGDELSAVFSSCIREYTDLPDRNSPDDDVYDLRRDLVKSFFAVYRLVLTKSLKEKTLPTVVNMFLNFGYVDADLAGHENANFLCDIADDFKGDPSMHIFTMREWLTSIYKGERDPSLSEFDMDYTAFLRDQKNSKQITAEEEKRMLADKEAKFNYELENAFPVVNRVTFGNPSKYCPVFSSHNLVRNIKDSLVTPEAIGKIIEEVRSIDFSAFYRETSYSDGKVGGISEHINVEVLPNIILTPTIGLRGSMWQEIEGRLRTTPARMFVPSFLENDLKALVLKLVAEFRWEICRRIQGTRWNDMTDPSLTSYFCDYLQFYMNNRNISMQTMTEIRNEISAARNNYKTVFVQNYAQWVLNESRGMARLNNISLGILMTFCPFSVEIRKRLELNMRFREALNRYNVRQQKKVTHFSNLIKKLQQNSRPIPPEIKAELEFWYK